MEEINECIFCKLISEGKLDERTIKESSEFIAFLDASPLVEGHTLIIPKEHEKWTWDVKNYEEYNNFAKDVANLLRKKLNVEKIDVLVSGGSVPHAHIHLLPSTTSKWSAVLDRFRELRKEVELPPSSETVRKLKD